jgi:ubiquinone/menaquinone biosynthesis C-methylase UbiE
MMNCKDKRIDNEIAHGKFIAERGEEIWNWSSPAGRSRWRRRTRLFLDFLGNDHKKVLEIGCGTGLFTKEICESANEIIAIDISKDLIDLARRRIKRGNVSFVIDNAYGTTFSGDHFDFVIGSSSLHHLIIDKALKEIYRLLKPEGRFMFTEPNMLNPQIAIQKNIPFVKKMAGDSPDETAFFRWSLAAKLERAGFRDISIVPFDFVHPAISKAMLSALCPILNFLETLPLLKEFAGSLIIKGRK